MDKWYDRIGYVKNVETRPGYWEEEIKEEYYKGNIINDRRNRDNGNSINSDINVNMSISIIADEYSVKNFAYIAYAYFHGVAWRVTSVTPGYPRITLQLGGVYNVAKDVGGFEEGSC